MDMIRWLATNKVVLAVWGLGILAILLSAIFGGGKKADHDTAATETKVVEATVEEAKPAAEAVAVAATTAAAAATTAAAAATTAAAAATSSTVQAAVDAGAETASDAAEGTTEVAETAVVAASEAEADTSAESSEVSASEESTEATVTTEESTEATDTAESALGDKSSDDLLMMAREAYWDNGLDEAANLYAELIAREPNVIEHKGELGNVFWRQGYPKKAAELYADIAEPMIAKGNGERVSNMVGFISLFFPERAASIRKQLDAQ